MDITEEIIDDRIAKWKEAITTAANNNIPKTDIQYNHRVKNSDLCNILRETYNQLKRRMEAEGLSQQNRTLLNNIQQELKIEYDRLHSESWNSKITAINNNSNDDTKFWKDIGKLRGKNNNTVPYLLDDNGIETNQFREGGNDFLLRQANQDRDQEPNVGNTLQIKDTSNGA